MKFLFLNNYHYLRGGSERVFFGEMELLRTHGHEVSSFSRKHERDLPARFSELFPQDMETESIRISLEAFHTLREVIYSKESRQSLTNLLDRFHPEMAHAHNIYGRLTPSVLDLLRKKNIPVVMTLHDYKLICPSYKLMHNGGVCEDCKGRNFYMAAWNRCHKGSLLASAVYALESYGNKWLKKYISNIRYCISPSRFLRKKFVEFGWPEDRIVYIPNYLVLSDFAPKYQPGDYFLYVGRLSAEKGISTLIQSFMKLNSKKAKLIIVGEGPEKEKLGKMADVDTRIKFTGYLTGKTLQNVTQNALGVIVPSEWYENAPISILESFAYGKPVIGARIGGIPEMISDQENGYLFESGNSHDLQEKLNLLLSSSKKKIIEMGKAAREKVEVEYNTQVHYERLMTVYNKALNLKPA